MSSTAQGAEDTGNQTVMADRLKVASTISASWYSHPCITLSPNECGQDPVAFIIFLKDPEDANLDLSSNYRSHMPITSIPNICAT